ncbi:YbaB/EbfC family nucleoid-associated protein [Sanguibacter sp. 25GB23B1]|uniref:YbaB/EbfC family nucleoid-associated protein n=1 Tax=unclassified Sanguibacter TaxID=2645534 RepID=UPI0032B018C0
MSTDDAWIQRLQEQALERLETAKTLQDALSTTRATATSRDRHVTMTVGASGVIVDLSFSDLDGTDADQLRASALEALRAAQSKASEAIAELTRSMPDAETIGSFLRGEVPEGTRSRLADELTERRAQQGATRG